MGRRVGRAVRVVAGAAAALVVAGGVSACDARDTGAAAVVGSRRITVDQLDEAVNGIKKGNPQLAQGDGLQRIVLFYLAISPYVTARAQAAGVGVSDDEAKAQLPKTKNPDPQALTVLRTFLSLQKLQGSSDPNALKAVQQDVVGAHIKVAPRYGTLDAKTLSIVDTSPNWLRPAPAATPTTPAP